MYLQVMLGLAKWWRVASFSCLAITIFVLITGTLTPRIITDKEAYHVGDIIQARWVLVNTYSWPIGITPIKYFESSIDGINGGYSWEHSDSNMIVFINWTNESFVIQPGEEFVILNRKFPVNSEGSFIITCGSESKTVTVYP
jgi:hypothetical protein